MAFTATTSLRKIVAMQSRLRVVQGGARAGKTVAILMCLIDMAQANEGLIISVISESLPHLKRGSMRDFLNIMRDPERYYFEDKMWNRTDYIYTFPNGSIIEFFGADSPDKVRGPARDVLFINECNNVPYETYRQLAMRTSGPVYLDFNPVASFYVHEKLIPNRPHDFQKLTYKDNEALAQSIVDEIESLKDTDPNQWRVYGLGEIGMNQGQIFDWTQIDSVPPEAELKRWGIDFGFVHDPTAIVGVYYLDGNYIIDEVTYQKGLDNKQIADILGGLDRALAIADSSEPKSIAEIESHLGRSRILGATKGPDSIRYGINLMLGQKIYVTKRSTNLIKEMRNYLWKVDKTGAPMNIPIDLWNHGMDAARYAFMDLLNQKPVGFRVRSVDD